MAGSDSPFAGLVVTTFWLGPFFSFGYLFDENESTA
jgi:hypothetical protein